VLKLTYSNVEIQKFSRGETPGPPYQRLAATNAARDRRPRLTCNAAVGRGSREGEGGKGEEGRGKGEEGKRGGEEERGWVGGNN
jgi:hypothetical protein